MIARITSGIGRVASTLARQHVALEPPFGAAAAARRAPPQAAPGVFAAQDVVLVAYLAIVSALVVLAGGGEAQALCARRSAAGLAAMLVGCALARGATFVAPEIRRAAYRVLLVGTVVCNYLSLRALLPVVRADSVDAALLRADLLLFGVEPALWLERWCTRPVVEWFSFFYFSYFWLCFLYMAVVIWCLRPGRWTTEFALGTAIVYCAGQLGYLAVPGYGPVVALADQFRAPLDGGVFWACVRGVVDAGGAQKDIFPSLHTAAPLWFTLFAARWAWKDRRFLAPAIVTGFFAVNIVISTMLLRWHDAVDVVAGVALAVAAGALAPRLAGWEEARRRRDGQPAPWSFS